MSVAHRHTIGAWRVPYRQGKPLYDPSLERSDEREEKCSVCGLYPATGCTGDHFEGGTANPVPNEPRRLREAPNPTLPAGRSPAAGGPSPWRDAA